MRQPPSSLTRQEAETQLRVALAGATDEKLLALTPTALVPLYRLKEREIEAILLAAQANRRRELAGGALA